VGSDDTVEVTKESTIKIIEASFMVTEQSESELKEELFDVTEICIQSLDTSAK